jgi:hypothetical protein
MRAMTRVWLVCAVISPLAFGQNKPDFLREIRPVLSDRCFACHGPDEQTRRANLRLDTAEGVAAAQDKILSRITHEKKALRMPPPGSPELSAPQVEALKTWIAEGAEFQNHWSFIPPQKPALPAVRNTAWPRNAVDRFILARLEQEKLTPSPAADRRTWLRRVTLDLTGLPPTPAEIRAFLADNTPKAYERVVDRLLASPHYGERMAMPWLDIARYADTHGFHIDSHREMWPWRDWVVKAFNQNLPYDQFVRLQLAGDLLPNATLDQQVASGFNRNHMINYEGGAIPEEYLVEYVVDRVETTSTAFLGLTLGCARCHDHKYDPIRQRDFYQFFAFFNTVNEKGLDGSKGNAKPFLPLPSPQQSREAAQIDSRIAELEDWMDEALVAERFESWAAAAWIPPARPADGQGAAASVRFKVSARLDALAQTIDLNPWKFWVDGGEAIGRNRRGSHFYIARGGQVFRSAEKFVTGDWFHVAINAGELWVNGAPAKLIPAPGATVPKDYSRAAVEPVRLYSQPLTEDDIRRLAIDEPVRDILAQPRDKRSSEQRQTLLRYYLERAAPESIRVASAELESLYRRRGDLEWEIPTTMVMAEMAIPRETKILARGDYRNGTDPVAPGVPSFLPPMPSHLPRTRFGLAEWLTSKDHPLTARVAVNRFWQMYFGTGLVKTVEDFGSQGETPSHPELLDWLATEFVESGWDVKSLQRQIVLSATYGQVSRVTPALLEKDPENRLLARGPRFRLPAEVIRDQALAASGLLNRQLGGPSVAPYQPAGIWEDIAYGDTFSSQTYQQDHGDKLYRRSMYSFWKRTAPPPGLATFDAPDREKCTARRAVTNTPLQALVLLNDPTYIEASRHLAAVAMTKPDPLAYLFEAALGRRPEAREATVLRSQFDQQLRLFANHPEGAARLLAVGESPAPATIDRPRLAAWTTIASVVLNLDEAVTKE